MPNKKQPVSNFTMSVIVRLVYLFIERIKLSNYGTKLINRIVSWVLFSSCALACMLL